MSTALGVYQLLSSPLHLEQASQHILIKKGDGLGQLTTDLERNGWLNMPPLLFKIVGRLTDTRGPIQMGEYEVYREMTAMELLNRLRAGEVVQRTVTFPEGWNFAEWLDQLLEVHYLVPMTEQQHKTFMNEKHLWEGRLYPDTYSYTRGETARAILDRAKSKMDAVLEEAWRNRSPDTEVTSQTEALILASMIEKETGLESDRSTIASVFNNRLARGMKLQSDPTVIYGIENFNGDLKRRHLKEPHPYNTYMIPGLPAGPICNPGSASITSALNPPATPYLYFVAKGDGSSYFSVTLDEHNEAVNRFQKAGRVNNYRSAPKTQ